MAEYIKRDDAIAAIKENCWDAHTPVEAVKSVPAADVAPVVHGRWVEQRHTFELPSGGGTCTGTYPTCSLCGAFETGLHLRTAYCPGCGAKMDKEDEKDNAEA